MSAIRLYAPTRLELFTGDLDRDHAESAHQGRDLVARADALPPVVLRLWNPDAGVDREARQAAPHPGLSLLERAAALHRNRCCPHCGRGTPVPQCDAPHGASLGQHAIPGEGDLLGFDCHSCGHYWSV
ncbi:MAG: hypothetical protein ACK5V1_22140 [Planctomycetaceae bacterium]